MTNRPTMKQNNSQQIGTRDNLEHDVDNSLSGFGNSLVKNVGDSFAGLGRSFFDQLTGKVPDNDTNPWGKEQTPFQREKPASPYKVIEKKNLFNFEQDIEAKRRMRELREMIKEIKKEVDAIKRADAALMGDVKDIENLSINTYSEKAGIYDIKFLEIVLRILRTLRQKIGESRTWLQALQSKKKKRGSLFAARSKKQGTQYSMSQELSNARSVQ